MLSFNHGYNTFSLTGQHLTISTFEDGRLTEQKTYALPDDIVGDITTAFVDYVFKITMHGIQPDDDVYTIEKFKELCESGFFIDSDGSGYYATETERSGYPANPSDFFHGFIDHRWTHVVWYNK